MDYEIPLSAIGERGESVQVEIKNGRFYISDRLGEPPHDVIVLYDTEVEELIHAAIAYLNRDNDGSLGKSRTGCSFQEFRVD